jgi:hypothetical protein
VLNDFVRSQGEKFRGGKPEVLGLCRRAILQELDAIHHHVTIPMACDLFFASDVRFESFLPLHICISAHAD